MIDIHCHILPMVDDGASSVKMALDLLVMAYEDGTDAIVLTPHLAYVYGYENPYHQIKRLFLDFQNIVKQEKIPIDLYLGTEYLFSSCENFLRHKDDITRMNKTSYILMEFFFDVSEEMIMEAVDLVLENQLIPIIAHPERYDCVQSSLDVIENIIQKGALLQMNKGSVFGKYGSHAREVILEMLDHHYIHFIGSDAHHPSYRSSKIYDDYVFVRDVYGEKYAQRIFYDNPINILNLRKREYDEEGD